MILRRRNGHLSQDQLSGGLWALVTGDALGVPVEFQSRGQLEQNPVTGMREHGSHNQPLGTWSDDSSMMLAGLNSLTQKRGYDPEDIMRQFWRWKRYHEYTPWGFVFDIGGTCRQAIDCWARYDIPAVKCGMNSEDSNGNGSLMWILPLCYYAVTQEMSGRLTLDQCASMVMEASGITHAHPVSRVGCALYFFMLRQMLCAGGSSSLEEALQQGLHDGFAFFDNRLAESGSDRRQPEDGNDRHTASVNGDQAGSPDHKSSKDWIGYGWPFALDENGQPDQQLLDKYDNALGRYHRLRQTHSFGQLPEKEIQSSGYVVSTLEAAVWCLLNTGTLRDALLQAANLGHDTDTVAAVTGGLGGTWYGLTAVPEEWRAVLARREWIDGLCRDYVAFLLLLYS